LISISKSNVHRWVFSGAQMTDSPVILNKRTMCQNTSQAAQSPFTVHCLLRPLSPSFDHQLKLFF